MPDDPIELLRRLNPVSAEPYTDADEVALQAILDAPPDELRDRRRIRHLTVGGIVLAGVVATAAWVALHEAPVTNPLQIACHATAERGVHRYVVADPGDPVAACAALWATGVFGDVAVPELTACTNESGTAAVFPGGPDVCARLGFAGVAPTEVAPDDVYLLAARLRTEFGPRCVPRDEAVRIVEALFDELGLDAWTIELTAPFHAGRPCTASGVDPARRTVSIGGVPATALEPTAPDAP